MGKKVGFADDGRRTLTVVLININEGTFSILRLLPFGHCIFVIFAGLVNLNRKRLNFFPMHVKRNFDSRGNIRDLAINQYLSRILNRVCASL